MDRPAWLQVGGGDVKGSSSTLNHDPSRAVLSELPQRVVVFLRAIATNLTIRSTLARAGFGEAEFREGWALLGAAFTYGPVDDSLDAAQATRAAQDEIEAWTSTQLGRLRIAVERLHPSESEIFLAVDVARVGSLLALMKLLDELALLEVRAVNSAQAFAALETLAKRGLDTAERQRLEELARVARSLPGAVAHLAVGAASDAQRVALIALYHWHCDWSLTAHQVIKRRDLLAVLGLVARKRRAA
jgi:hypothetical protein